MIVILLVIALVAALVLAAFCAGAETGFFSLNRGRIVYMARRGSTKAKVIEKALADRARTLTCLLVGNNLGSVAFSAASAALAARAFPEGLMSRTVWSVCAACVMLAAGEFLPKLFCSTRPLRRTLRLAPAYRVFELVMRPLTLVALFLTSLFDSKKPAAREKVTADELLQILSDRKDGVKLTDFESALIARILVLRKRGEAVTPESLFKVLESPDEPEAARAR